MQSAIRAGARPQIGALGGSDRADYGQPEPLTLPAPRLHLPGGTEPLKRREQPGHLTRRHHRTGVCRREHSLPVLSADPQTDPAAWNVVPDRVVDKVGDKALGKPRIT